MFYNKSLSERSGCKMKWNAEVITFVNRLKNKYEDLLFDAQFDVQKKAMDLVERIGSDIMNEIDAKYNSDMKAFKTMNECFKVQSKIYHAFVDFLHDFGNKNGKKSLYY
jgi:hypothetical protein